jgi:hypothetical protein
MSINSFAITPTDSTLLASPASALYIGVTGDVALSLGGDSTSTVFKAVAQGWFKLPAQTPATIVWATGTTATNIVGVIKASQAF